jgi:hypothetical protein
MRKISVFVNVLVFCSITNVFAQSISEKEKIKVEIEILFEKSIKAGETLNIAGIKSNVDDELKAGFIDNGKYYESFNILMNDFEIGTKNLVSQKMNITNKRITVFSNDTVLLTADGDYSVAAKDGRTFTGKFAWTFVYVKMNEEWKIAHSHMSNPR